MQTVWCLLLTQLVHRGMKLMLPSWRVALGSRPFSLPPQALLNQWWLKMCSALLYSALRALFFLSRTCLGCFTLFCQCCICIWASNGSHSLVSIYHCSLSYWDHTTDTLTMCKFRVTLSGCTLLVEAYVLPSLTDDLDLVLGMNCYPSMMHCWAALLVWPLWSISHHIL